MNATATDYLESYYQFFQQASNRSSSFTLEEGTWKTYLILVETSQAFSSKECVCGKDTKVFLNGQDISGLDCLS